MSTTNQKKFLDQTPIQKFFSGRFFIRNLKHPATDTTISILELGCGEGYLLEQVHRRLPTIPGLG